jgi:gas vesicle protein
MARDDERDVVYLEREGGGLKSLLVGAVVGFALGLLFAPQSGWETRRALRRRFRKVRAAAGEKVDELTGKLSDELRGMRQSLSGEGGEEEEPEVPPARAELERRLAEARARRRARAAGGDEEPVA